MESVRDYEPEIQVNRQADKTGRQVIRTETIKRAKTSKQKSP